MDDKSNWNKTSSTLLSRMRCCAFHSGQAPANIAVGIDVGESGEDKGILNGSLVHQLSMYTVDFDAAKQSEALNLLATCGNLMDLTFCVFDASSLSPGFDAESGFLERLSDAFSMFSLSLRSLKLSVKIRQTAVPALMRALTRLKELRSLSVRGGIFLEDFGTSYFPLRPKFPHLYSVCYHNDIKGHQYSLLSDFAFWRIPSVRFLHILGGADVHDGRVFIEMHRDKLTDVILDYHPSCEVEARPREDVLTNVALSVQLIPNIFAGDASYSALRYVGVIGRFSCPSRIQALDGDMNRFDDALCSLMDENMFPAVRRVQLTRIKMQSVLSRKWSVQHLDMWKRWVSDAKGRGISLVDKRGRDLKIPNQRH